MTTFTERTFYIVSNAAFNSEGLPVVSYVQSINNYKVMFSWNGEIKEGRIKEENGEQVIRPEIKDSKLVIKSSNLANQIARVRFGTMKPPSVELEDGKTIFPAGLMLEKAKAVMNMTIAKAVQEINQDVIKISGAIVYFRSQKNILAATNPFLAETMQMSIDSLEYDLKYAMGFVQLMQ